MKKPNVWLAAVNLAALEEGQQIQLQLVRNDNTPSLQGVVLQYMS
jgi:hypothetical protein